MHPLYQFMHIICPPCVRALLCVSSALGHARIFESIATIFNVTSTKRSAYNSSQCAGSVCHSAN